MNEPITKPSRLNRRRKKRWKITTLSANLCLAGNKPAGFSRPHSKGVQSPLLSVVFLCQKISALLKTAESFYYGVVILGGMKIPPHLCAALLTLFNHAALFLAVMGGGYSILSKGFTA